MKRSKSKKGAHAMKAIRGKKRIHSSHGKKMTSLQKARAAKKAVRAKLAALKIEFKTKLMRTAANTYGKAQQDFQRLLDKKEKAKQKILAAAEAKFNKKFAKKLAKKSKKHHKKSKTKTTTMPHAAKRRGRPPKKHK